MLGLSFLWVWSGHQLLQEWLVLDETVLVLGITAVLQDLLGLVLVQALTKRLKNVREFSKGHLSIAVLVVQLEDFCKVLNVADVLVLLGLAENWEEFVNLQLLLVPLFGSAELLDELLGWGEVEGTEHVTEVERVHRVAALKVVDAERELCALNITGRQFTGHVSYRVTLHRIRVRCKKKE